MKDKILITPKKPIIIKGVFGSMIKLNKTQVNYSNLKFKKGLKGFKEQTLRHITIVGGKTTKKIEKALKRFSVVERKKKIIQIKFILKNLRWQYIQKEIYFINKKGYFGNLRVLEHRWAYIRMINMPDISIFYHELNKILKTKIPTQVPHITLFTKGERRNPDFFGIPINSKVEFKKLKPKKIKL